MSLRSVKRGSWRRWKKIFVVGYGVLAFAGLYNYINWRSATFFVGVLTLLYTPPPDKPAAAHFRFGWMGFALSVMFFFLPVKTILYGVLACAIFSLRETFYRRVPPSMPIVLLLMAPATEYFVQIFSFPIRLKLTTLAGQLISLTGQPVEITGNILAWHGTSFSVDPACIGLHMMITSLLAALLLMNYYQSHYRRRLRPMIQLSLLCVVAGLNIVANLLRIVVLIFFVIPPDNPMHGFLGLIILAGYVLLPMIPLIRWIIQRWGRAVEKDADIETHTRSRWLLTGNWLIAACAVVVVAKSLLNDIRPVRPYPEKASIAGYSVRRLAGPVLQLDNGRSLVYIKPIPDFYYTEHSPMLCWEGSGYRFGQLQERSLHGIRLYEGQLQKGSEVLYTAWWYDNGIRQTAGTLDWRWDVLRGGLPYSIVNITTTSSRLLEAEVEKIITTRPFQALLALQDTP